MKFLDFADKLYSEANLITVVFTKFLTLIPIIFTLIFGVTSFFRNDTILFLVLAILLNYIISPLLYFKYADKFKYIIYLLLIIPILNLIIAIFSGSFGSWISGGMSGGSVSYSYFDIALITFYLLSQLFISVFNLICTFKKINP